MTRTTLQYFEILANSLSIALRPRGSCHFLEALVKALFLALYLWTATIKREVSFTWLCKRRQHLSTQGKVSITLLTWKNYLSSKVERRVKAIRIK